MSLCDSWASVSHTQAGVDVGDVLDELCGEAVLDYSHGKVGPFSPPLMGRFLSHQVSHM